MAETKTQKPAEAAGVTEEQESSGFWGLGTVLFIGALLMLARWFVLSIPSKTAEDVGDAIVDVERRLLQKGPPSSDESQNQDAVRKMEEAFTKLADACAKEEGLGSYEELLEKSESEEAGMISELSQHMQAFRNSPAAVKSFTAMLERMKAEGKTAKDILHTVHPMTAVLSKLSGSLGKMKDGEVYNYISVYSALTTGRKEGDIDTLMDGLRTHYMQEGDQLSEANAADKEKSAELIREIAEKLDGVDKNGSLAATRDKLRALADKVVPLIISSTSPDTGQSTAR